jgi:hypothetical protein
MTKITLADVDPIITVNAEFTKLYIEYFTDTNATTRLIIKPTIPESNRYLLSDMVLLYFVSKCVRKLIIVLTDFIFT